MISDRALSGKKGIIGFVPRDAFDSPSGCITIEVMVEFEEQESTAISVKTSLLELQERLRSTTTRELCDWLRERARAQAMLDRPSLIALPSQSGKISWMCQGPVRREPFLRF
ncbi:MAG: hypothetical protein ACRDHN_09030 [Thermomicrobiales bacterium]